MAKIYKDRLSVSDSRPENLKMPELQSKGLWARTEVIASYDDIEYDKNGIAHFIKKIPDGISALGETLFRKEKGSVLWTQSNMVPIGGCQFAMETLFGVKATNYTVPTLKSQMGIGLDDASSIETKYNVPDGPKTAPHNVGNVIQLFGIGITGNNDDTSTVYPVDYREYSIEMDKETNKKGLTGTMIPFRYTNAVLGNDEKKQYFGKKLNSDDGNTAYYLKRFSSDPEIKHIWKSGEDVGNEPDVSPNEVWTNNTSDSVIESFTQCTLKITKDDAKEWFIAQGQEEIARINTIALFTGEYVPNSDGTIGDYRNICMFSKLNIPVEYLSLNKDLNLIYRVYTA